MNRISVVFPELTLNFPTDLKHIHEPLPSVFLVVYLEVLPEPCEVIRSISSVSTRGGSTSSTVAW